MARNKSYFTLKKGIKIGPVEKKLVAAHKHVFRHYARALEDGYNKIVSNWDASVRPSFKGTIEHKKSRNTIYVYVRINGSEKAKVVFKTIDFGGKRWQDVSAPEGASSMLSAAARSNLVQAPGPMPMPPADIRDKKGNRVNVEEWTDYQGKVKARRAEQKAFRAAVKKIQRRQRRGGPGRTKRGSRLGPQKYERKTGVRGKLTGPGQSRGTPKKSLGQRPKGGDPAWRGWGQPQSMKLRPVAARGWTVSLRLLASGETGGTYVARKIWGKGMSVREMALLAIEYANLPWWHKAHGRR